MNIIERADRGALTACIVACVGMLAAAYLLLPPLPCNGDMGVCLPAPQCWGIPMPQTWILNIVASGCVIVGAALLDRTFQFIRTRYLFMPALLAVAWASVPSETLGVNTSTVLALTNLVATWFLFTTWRKTSATQEFFVIAALLSLGTMVSYSFVPSVLAFLIGGIAMKSLTVKGLLAYLLGLLSPYWIAIGFGLVNPLEFHAPVLPPPSEAAGILARFPATAAAAALSALLGFIFSVANTVRLLSGNAKVRALNMAVNILGYCTMAGALIDFSHLSSWVGTLFLWVAVQTANLLALHRTGNSDLWFGLIAALYAAIFVWEI